MYCLTDMKFYFEIRHIQNIFENYFIVWIQMLCISLPLHYVHSIVCRSYNMSVDGFLMLKKSSWSPEKCLDIQLSITHSLSCDEAIEKMFTASCISRDVRWGSPEISFEKFALNLYQLVDCGWEAQQYFVMCPDLRHWWHSLSCFCSRCSLNNLLPKPCWNGALPVVSWT